MHPTIRHRPRRSGATLALAVLAIALGVSPAAAGSGPAQRGTVGWYELEDSADRPGARCRYDGTHGDWGYSIELTRLSVKPPRMRAAEGSQTVGWRFIVWRTPLEQEPRVVGRSPIQQATATTTENAVFGRMWMPIDERRHGDISYHAIVRMFWYGADGSRQGVAWDTVDFYRTVKFYGIGTSGPCEAREGAASH